MLQETTSKEQSLEIVLNGFKRSCQKCSHFKVCTIYRALTPLLQKWNPGTRPFNAEDVAAICTLYFPEEAMPTR